MLITDNYRDINKQLHENEHYGRSGHCWHKSVMELMKVYDSDDVLDYGCGKGMLGVYIKELTGVDIKEYDPAITGKEAPPKPADIVVCTDVLEHIEPECINAVFLDLKRVIKQVGFLTIALRPARKNLPDGRNAHILLKPPKWWLYKLNKHFTVRHIEVNASGSDELNILVSPKEAEHETDPDIHRL